MLLQPDRRKYRKLSHHWGKVLKVSRLLCFYRFFRLKDLSIRAALFLINKNSTNKNNDMEKTIKLNTGRASTGINLLQALMRLHSVFAQIPQQARS